MTPNFPEKLKEAVRLKQGKDYQTAWQIFSNLAGETNPDSAYFWFNYAHLAFLMKRYDQAKSLVETALSIDPRDRFSRSLYAGLLLRSGDGESALTIVDELMEKQPEIPLLRKVVAESERRNILRELQPFMEKWLVRYEQDPELLGIAAEFFHKIGQDEKAIQYYQQVVDREPENQFAYERLLALKTAGKGIEERIKQLTLILKMPSREKNVHLLGLLAREYKKPVIGTGRNGLTARFCLWIPIICSNANSWDFCTPKRAIITPRRTFCKTVLRLTRMIILSVHPSFPAGKK